MLKKFFFLLLGTALLLAGCGTVATEQASDAQRPLVISAIPDQDPEKLQRL